MPTSSDFYADAYLRFLGWPVYTLNYCFCLSQECPILGGGGGVVVKFFRSNLSIQIEDSLYNGQFWGSYLGQRGEKGRFSNKNKQIAQMREF